MTKLSSLSALPVLHYRVSYGRPKSDLQRLCILIVTLLLDFSPLVALGDSCSTLVIVPIVSGRSQTFLVLCRLYCFCRRRCCRLRLCCCCCYAFLCFWFQESMRVVVPRFCVFGFCYFMLGLRIPTSETRLRVYCWLQVSFHSESNTHGVMSGIALGRSFV